MSYRVLGACALTLALLTGCADYDVGRQLARRPPGDAFLAELQDDYGALALDARRRADWEAVPFWIAKAQSVDQGRAPPPEPIDPATASPEILRARAELDAMFTGPTRRAEPDRVARAQVAFDCWVDRTRRGRGEAAIARCRDDFRQAMETEDLVFVRFAAGSAALDTEARRAIAGLAARSPATSQLRLAGHADPGGESRQDLNLAERRARAVHAALLAAGVAPARITFANYGDAWPRVGTAPGRAEPLNRRVEIELRDPARSTPSSRTPGVP